MRERERVNNRQYKRVIHSKIYHSTPPPPLQCITSDLCLEQGPGNGTALSVQRVPGIPGGVSAKRVEKHGLIFCIRNRGRCAFLREKRGALNDICKVCYR